MSGKRQQLTHMAHSLAETARRVGHLLVEPLRVDPDTEFGLAIPDAQTTAMRGDVGWFDRPPAVVECQECESEIYQHRPTTDLDCPECWREFPCEEFPELKLVRLVCPVCQERMKHGRRHPQQFDVPEWASCTNCQYHWEFEHF